MVMLNRNTAVVEHERLHKVALALQLRAGMVAPDETTFNYLKGRHGIEHGMSPPHLAFLEHRPLCPKGKDWDKAG